MISPLTWSNIRSRSLAEINPDTVDIVITFDLQCFDILKNDARFAKRTFLLGCLDNDERNIIIEDPYSKSYSVHEDTFRRIKNNIEYLAGINLDL